MIDLSHIKQGVILMTQRNRYQKMELYMTGILLAALTLFVLYFVFAGIVWVKVILSILIILICCLCLTYLYLTGELRKPRSLWMGTAAAALLVCLIVSLLLSFP